MLSDSRTGSPAAFCGANVTVTLPNVRLWLEHFDRDLPIVFDVMSEIHGRHAALTELALDAIPLGQGAAKAGRSVGNSASYL
jgi:hypothetical protein